MSKRRNGLFQFGAKCFTQGTLATIQDFPCFFAVIKCSLGLFRADGMQLKAKQPPGLEQHGNLVPVASCQLYFFKKKLIIFFFLIQI